MPANLRRKEPLISLNNLRKSAHSIRVYLRESPFARRSALKKKLVPLNNLRKSAHSISVYLRELYFAANLRR